MSFAFSDSNSDSEAFGLQQQPSPSGLRDTAASVRPAQYHLELGNEHLQLFQKRSRPTSHASHSSVPPSTQIELVNAISHYRRALELDPKLSEAYLQLAKALLIKGDIDLETAAHYCQMATHYNPGHRQSHLLCIHYLLADGQVKKALEQCYLARQATKSAHPALSWAFTQSWFNAAFSQQFSPWQRIGAMINASLSFGATIGLLPIYGLAAVSQWANHTTTVKAKTPEIKPMAPHRSFRQLLAEQDGHTIKKPPVNSKQFETLFEQAQEAIDAKQYFQALYWLKQAKQFDAHNPYLHSNSAYVMFKLEDYDGALSEYHAAIDYGEDPLWISTIAQTIGMIYAKLKNEPAKAIEMLKLSHDLYSNNVDCMTMLADLLVDHGEPESAVVLYQQLVQQDPAHAPYHTFLGYLYWMLGQTNAAIDAYQKSLDLDPQEAITLNNLGVIFLDDLSDASKSLPLFQQAFTHKQDYTLACFNIGRAYQSLGNIQQAADYYQQAQALNQKTSDMQDSEINQYLNSLFHAD